MKLKPEFNFNFARKISFFTFWILIFAIIIGAVIKNTIFLRISLGLFGVYIMIPGIFLLWKPNISFAWYQGLKLWFPTDQWEKANDLQKFFLILGSITGLIFGVGLIASLF
jgi:hypothetical protein